MIIENATLSDRPKTERSAPLSDPNASGGMLGTMTDPYRGSRPREDESHKPAKIQGRAWFRKKKRS